MDRSSQSGSIEDLKPWLDAHPHEIERTFEDKIVMPDFIDPHLHPLLGAMVSANPYYLYECGGRPLQALVGML